MNVKVVKSITDKVPVLARANQSTHTLRDKVGIIYGIKIKGS